MSDTAEAGYVTNATSDWTPVHRVVFPADGDTTLLPLYVDQGASAPAPRPESLAPTQQHLVTALRDSLRAEIVGGHTADVSFGRSHLTVAPKHRVSFATYFNAFPASYWQEHTDVDRVRIDLSVSGAARIDLFRSNARGKYVRMDSAEIDDRAVSFEIPLDRFGDGGWLWFDLEAHGAPATLTSATWSVPAEAAQRPRIRATVAIPSFNMPGACIDQINRFADHPDVLDSLSRVVIIDQGTNRLRDHVLFPAAASRLGDQLLVIEQPNLGGSGGFSRGMLEMTRDTSSDAVLLLDDDAEAEPESIVRAIRFSEFTRGPRIVGGHMLNASERTVLHSFGETINWDSFWWEAVDPQLSAVDFRYSSIRTTPALSRRMDVTYNGWWMCLIPRSVVEEVGLSLPFFIKWDDAEYALRASKAAVPTISLPGVAAWHVPWDEKDDGLDWQAYFHQRNRLVTALLHSPRRRGGSMVRRNLASDLKHILSMQYTATLLRAAALRDVLAGPEHMDGTLEESAVRARSLAAGMIKRRADFPPVQAHQPGVRAVRLRRPLGVLSFGVSAVRGFWHQLTTPRAAAPQERGRAVDAKWWRLAGLDQALVSNAAGSGVWGYRRDAALVRREAARSVRNHISLYLNWPRLSKAYRERERSLSSIETWERTLLP